MLTELKNAEKVIGVKQSRKAIRDGVAKKVYVAQNADSRVREPVVALSNELKVEVVEVATMEELGHACGIGVGAAVAVII
ncbi:MAG: ribosomal L7Ae/L30e/S12e/Gadd45 family protein [Clostridia bacterium]